jgi:hypothetical protein
MSNVLIGIIGVILFIGLALAGALILGSDFTTATSSSKAATVSQQLTQISAAINMYQLKTGQTALATPANSNGAFLMPRFLKSYPVNPTNGNPYNINDASANVGGGPVRMVITSIGAQADARARDVCQAIEEQATQGAFDGTPKADFGATVTSRASVGCFLYNNGFYYAYISV